MLELIEELEIVRCVLDEPEVLLLLETAPVLLVLNLEELERPVDEAEVSLELDVMLEDDDFELLEAILLDDVRVVVERTLDIFELERATDVDEDSFELDLLLELAGLDIDTTLDEAVVLIDVELTTELALEDVEDEIFRDVLVDASCIDVTMLVEILRLLEKTDEDADSRDTDENSDEDEDFKGIDDVFDEGVGLKELLVAATFAEATNVTPPAAATGTRSLIVVERGFETEVGGDSCLDEETIEALKVGTAAAPFIKNRG